MKTNEIKAMSKKMFENQSFDEYNIDDFTTILTKCDDLYYNDESFLSDSDYDFLRKYAETIAPANVYFTGVGSDVRGGKVKLPYEMGSLDQVEIGNISDWITKHNLQEELIVATDKLDGTSAMIIYGENGDLQIAYSRGNGVEGADITRHLKNLRSVPKTVENSIVIRGETIIEKATFPYLCKEVTRKSGNAYKNPRNAVAGFMNSKTTNPKVYDYIKFVAYQIVGSSLSKIKQLEYLETLGFEVPHYAVGRGIEISDNLLASRLDLRRQNSVYEIDGLVLDVNDSKKRAEMNPTRDTLNPAYSIKYKVADSENLAQATVVKVEWNISKHGYLKPRIQIEPIELGGVTITYCTGFNAAYIVNNNIGKGAVISITRSGDVIPFCLGVIVPAKPDYPEGFKWEWTVNDAGENVDAILIDVDSYDEVTIKRTIDFFSKIDAPMLKKGNIEKLFTAKFDTIESIIYASVDELVEVLGENGYKVFEGLTDKLTNVPLYKIMGAYSNERGIGIRRLKKLQEALGKDDMLMCSDANVVASVEGFDSKTAEQTITVINSFITFYSDVSGIITIAEDEKVGSTLEGMQICFTGIRDKELAAHVESLGGKVTSSVSGKTTMVVAKDPTSTSGKPQKAREFGIPIMDISEFRNYIMEM